MTLTDRDIYATKRRKARIKLKDIADAIGCSLSLISKYELNQTNMSDEKIAKYRQYIDQRYAF